MGKNCANLSMYKKVTDQIVLTLLVVPLIVKMAIYIWSFVIMV